METQYQISLSDAPNNGRRGDDLKQPLVEKASRFRVFPAILGGAAFAVVAAWFFISHRETSAAPAMGNGVPASIPVSVQTVARQKLRLWNDFSGRLRAVNSADIRPEVSGRITEVRFQDGQTVKAGDILFVIDPRSYQATVDRDRANVASAQSKLELALFDQRRAQALFGSRAIAQSDLDKFNEQQRSAQAALDAARADLAQAEVDLDHAYVKASISGRVSRAELTVGNLVQGGSGASTPPPLLTSIVSSDSVYADFEVDEQTYLDTIRDAANGNAQEKTIPVELVVQGDTGRVYRGFIQNFDNRIDAASGTIRARAKFDNTEATLVPGMFVSVRLASSRVWDLTLIPDRAIGFDQSKKFVFVVSTENKVGYQEIELGRELGGQRVVLKGLQAGDRVIVDGVQRVHPDATVSPQEVAPPAQAAAAEGETRTAQADGTVQKRDDDQ
jgi:multidrug efflux system membrane fusion protein